MRFICNERHAGTVADTGDRCDIRQHALVGRACDHNGAGIRIAREQLLHMRRRYTAVNAVSIVKRWIYPVHAQVQELCRMQNRLVAVSRSNNFTSGPRSAPDSGKNSDSAAADKVPCLIRAEQTRSPVHGFFENPLRVMEVVYTFHFGQIPVIRESGRRGKLSFMPRHMKRIQVPADIGPQLRLENILFFAGVFARAVLTGNH